MKHNEGKSVPEIASELNVKKTFIYDMLTLQRETGSIDPKPASGGRKAEIDDERLEQLAAIVTRTPDITLLEIKEELGLNVSISAICNALNHKLNLRLKKDTVRHRAKQRRSTRSP